MLHEKYENATKRALRLLTTIGIISSVITLPWHLSLSIAVLLLIIEQWLERAVFQYSSMFIQPLPDFLYDPTEWKGMGFAFPEASDPRALSCVGCAFASEEYAKKFFRLLRAWNYNQDEDRENNIKLSFIIEDRRNYSIYLYPSQDRTAIKETFEQIEKAQQEKKRGKEHQKLTFQMVFSREFVYKPDSKLAQFIAAQRDNRPYWLHAFVQDPNGQVRMLHDSNPS